MIPILFNRDELSFASNGLGRLGDAISCMVTKAYGNNSFQYTLEMKYPITGPHFEDLNVFNIIFAVPELGALPQAFRIRKVTRPLNGIVTVYADHISYDLANYPVYMTSDKTGAENAIKAVGTDTKGISNPFVFSTNISDTATVMEHPDGPVTARELLLMEGGVQDTFGGEWVFDNYNVALNMSVGEDRGVTLRRGKNITDLEQTIDTESSFSGIFPYWAKNDETVILSEYILTVSESYVNAIAIVDLSKEFKDKPTEAQLRAKAQAYLNKYITAQPSVSTDVDFVPLSQTLEYADIAAIETVRLYDVVHVVYGTLNIDVKTKVCKTVYNVLLNRYDSVELGMVKSSIYSTIKKISGGGGKPTYTSGGGSVMTDFLSQIKSVNTSGERVSVSSTHDSLTTILSVTAPMDGYVVVTGHVQFEVNGTNRRHAQVKVGNTVVSQSTIAAYSTTSGMVLAAGAYPVSSGDAVAIQAWQDSGSTLYAGGMLEALFIGATLPDGDNLGYG